MQRRRVWSFRACPGRAPVLGGERGVDVGRAAQQERAWRERRVHILAKSTNFAFRPRVADGRCCRQRRCR
eukprot:5188522-Prymnesium_polylepis.1